jgi:tetratricopeptide (TPR) repeat protein
LHAAEARASAAEARAGELEDRSARLALDLRIALDRLDLLEAAKGNLERNHSRLQADRDTLDARLREALSPRPAALDPAELAKSEERNRFLMKENEILKASLEHQMTENRNLMLAAKRAFELEELLNQSQAELASYRRESLELRRDRDRLQARIDTLARRDRDASALEKEVADLRRRLNDRTQPNPSTDAASAEKEMASLRRTNDDLRRDNAVLIREIERLSSVQVTPASLKVSEVANPDFFPAEANRIRQLERERDDLRRQLDQSRKERSQPDPSSTEPLLRQVRHLNARIATLEADAVPYSPEELALFQVPANPTPLLIAQANPPATTPPPTAANPAPANTPAPIPGTNASAGTPPASSETAATSTTPTSRRRTIRDLPAGAGILAAQAQRAFNNRRLPEAEAAYLEILKLDENNVFTLGNLGAIILEQGRIPEAEAYLDRALAIDPEDPFCLSLRGIVRFRQQRYDEAFEALSRSAQIDPENADTQNYLGITLSQRGQRTAAEAALRRALKLNPNSASAHYNLAVVYATQQPPFLELARFHYDKARRTGQPANPAFEAVLRGEPAPTTPGPSSPQP